MQKAPDGINYDSDFHMMEIARSENISSNYENPNYKMSGRTLPYDLVD